MPKPHQIRHLLRNQLKIWFNSNETTNHFHFFSYWDSASISPSMAIWWGELLCRLKAIHKPMPKFFTWVMSQWVLLKHFAKSVLSSWLKKKMNQDIPDISKIVKNSSKFNLWPSLVEMEEYTNTNEDYNKCSQGTNHWPEWHSKKMISSRSELTLSHLICSLQILAQTWSHLFLHAFHFWQAQHSLCTEAVLNTQYIWFDKDCGNIQHSRELVSGSFNHEKVLGWLKEDFSMNDISFLFGIFKDEWIVVFDVLQICVDCTH